LAEGQVLDHQAASRAHGREERRQDGYEEAEHRAGENPGPREKSSIVPVRMDLWRATSYRKTLSSDQERRFEAPTRKEMNMLAATYEGSPAEPVGDPTLVPAMVLR